ncbi:GGDEF domain-containing protein [Malaciobacter halophilus]|uniref:diguanylate cyclase n=1 Tax=Malaciobacter halophilus TaxID=197482 RepID=A0A2N1J219_9BACT|nr:GGDEF domain-containing protein [Malaciobacter halophilus]AXH10106.1 diguanylate cyclase [Malaciobacter halophilus]PKI80591.1 GGDEF domain-containing protein [Malaciobacter halophilus]
MGNNIKLVAKETIKNLFTKGIEPTPNEYHKEFCSIAKEYKLNTKECIQFKELVSKLNKEEQEEIKSKNITTFEDMIPILLNRVATKNLKTLTSLFQDSMTPSISIGLDEKLTKFSVKIGNSPALLFEEDIQKEMQSFITKRFEADKKVVQEKTAEIAKLVTLMGRHLNEAISSSGNSGTEVSNIKDEIQAINLSNNGIQELTNLQSKLINAAMSIENEMNQVGEKLSSGKDKVEELEEKVKKLEDELSKSKQESLKDHLTGVLTRKAYEYEAKKVEENYKRNDTQYAIVFFDIDHFKAINDTYGHAGGDMILSTFGKILSKYTRDMDIVGRYGGEEFIAIIHFNLKRELLKYLKRIKSIVNENNFVYGKNKIRITFSAGVTIRNDHESYESAIQKADVLLYKAKEDGRNKIILEDNTCI